MRLWLGNRWMSIEEAMAALGCSQQELLSIAAAGKLAVHYDTVVYQKVPRRSRREPFFLLAEVEALRKENQTKAFVVSSANA